MSSIYGRTVRSVVNSSRHAEIESANKAKANKVKDSTNHIICLSCDVGGQIASIHRRETRDKEAPGALPPRSNAVDAAVHIATRVMTNRSARHRTRPQHDTCPGNAARWICGVLAIHDRIGWLGIESKTCKPQQGTGCNPGKRCGFDSRNVGSSKLWSDEGT